MSLDLNSMPGRAQFNAAVLLQAVFHQAELGGSSADSARAAVANLQPAGVAGFWQPPALRIEAENKLTLEMFIGLLRGAYKAACEQAKRDPAEDDICPQCYQPTSPEEPCGCGIPLRGEQN